jgi:hypothetical protein
MNIEAGRMIPLGYGKYFRSDRIVGLEPIEEGRGPGQRTNVYLASWPHPSSPHARRERSSATWSNCPGRSRKSASSGSC